MTKKAVKLSTFNTDKPIWHISDPMLNIAIKKSMDIKIADAGTYQSLIS
jgi:hypothetical protein